MVTSQGFKGKEETDENTLEDGLVGSKNGGGGGRLALKQTDP